MTYQETLDYLFSALPMYQRIGQAAFKKDLTNTLKFCEQIDDPHYKFKSVHIAGTNGKGSSAHMLAAILQSAGCKTGLYTSPHLKSFTERIKINGQEITEAEVTQFVANNKEQIEAIQPSFFETTVVMAFDHFARHKVDIAIIETGLGGRLDSTNVITPLVSLITNIGYDHQLMLGNTLSEIAGEKAGIIKEHIPVVTNEMIDEAKQVFVDKARSLDSPFYYGPDHYRGVKTEKGKLSIYRSNQLYLENLIFGLAGDYQIDNLPGVLLTTELLNSNGYVIQENHIKWGLKNTSQITGLKGRWQILGDSPKMICDTAHNGAGIRAVMKQLNEIDHQDMHIVWGMVNDKEIEKTLELLPTRAHYYFCQAKVPRALDAFTLFEKAKKCGLKGVVIPEVNTAIEDARRLAKEEDLIFIGGSTFVVAEIKKL